MASVLIIMAECFRIGKNIHVDVTHTCRGSRGRLKTNAMLPKVVKASRF
jgi:hypothetical protein